MAGDVVPPLSRRHHTGRARARAAQWIAVLLLLAGAPPDARAQAIPIEDYVQFVPLGVPRAFRQTSASERFALYPLPGTPGYRDVDPRDGLDDARTALLTRLSARMSPILIQNTHMGPMDHQRFVRPDGSQFLYIDDWNMGVPTGRFQARDSIDLLRARANPCRPGGATTDTSDDCRLRQLILDYHPNHPASAIARAQAIAVNEDPFYVFFLDFPGDDPKSWKQAFRDQDGSLRPEYRDHILIYSHPFLVDVEGGYEFVLQYWFFYPYNDGGNNHLGDWEHVNVFVARRGQVERPWTAGEIESLLRGEEIDATGDRELVLRKIDYYFHSKILTLDFAHPNVYLPRDEWKKERDEAIHTRNASDWLLDRTRERAYRDREQTVVNTHPIGFIGADNKGTDQILSAPGGTNQESHGTYPFSGLFRDIGPAAAAEEIRRDFDHVAFFESTPEEQAEHESHYRGGGVLRFDERRLQILPDFEPVLDGLLDDPEIRYRWYWLVVPVRYGYPAVVSPFAGIVAHAETGNLAVLGPSMNGGWNSVGVNRAFAGYDPNVLPGLFPTAWQDNFQNDLGFLNLTYPTWILLPPFDLLWNVAAAPVRLFTERNAPTFFPSEKLPVRFAGLAGGIAVHEISQDFEDLIVNRDQFRSFFFAWLDYLTSNGADSTTVITSSRSLTEAAQGFFFDADFYVGSRFVSMNSFRHSRSRVGVEQTYSNISTPLRIESELTMWEYAGTLRYNIATGTLLPYAKLGYGLSWYRLEKGSLNGVQIDVPNSPWVRKPTIQDLGSFLPNTWHFGLGAEWFLVRQPSPRFLSGIDVTLRADWTVYSHDLGLDFEDVPVEDLITLGVPATELPTNVRIWRHALAGGVTVSF